MLQLLAETDQILGLTLSNAYLATIGKSIYEPQTYQEAISSSAGDHWHDAMHQELTSLHDNQTWRLVPLRADMKAVRNKWVFKIKYKANGEIEKCKA